MNTHLAIAFCIISVTAACATEQGGEAPWGPIDSKADNTFGGELDVVGSLSIGRTASFTFTGREETPALRIHGRQGQAISSMATISNNAPPWLYIVDRDMEIIAQSSFDDAFVADGVRGTALTAELPEDGTYYIGLSSTYSRSRVKGATITVDLEPADEQECAPVTCELLCRDGFQVDANGCEVCACK